MAIAALTPKIMSARFLSILDRVNVWSGFTNENYTGELTSAGSTVQIPTFTKAITVSDYNEDGAIGSRLSAAEEVTGTSQELTVDLKKATHFLVEDIEEVQTKPQLMSTAIGRASVAVSNAVDNYLHGVFNKSFDKGYTQIGGSNEAARIANISARTENVAVATVPTAASGAFGTALLPAVAKLKRKMALANIPEAGRWMVVHPDTILGLELYFMGNNATGVFTPVTDEATLRNGFAGNLLGFDLRVSTNVQSVQQSAAGDSWQLVAGQGNESVTMARQLVESEMYRPERHFADAYKSLYVAGARNVLPERLFRVVHAKSA